MHLSTPLMALLVVVVLAVFYMTACRREVSEDQLFFPRRIPVVDAIEGRQNVSIEASDGETIRGWYYYDAGRSKTVIYTYGNGETVFDSQYRLTWLVDHLDVNVLAIDYRGYGFSDGSPSIDDLRQDILTVYDYLVRDLGGADQSVYAFGRSIGTAAALRLASERDLDGLVLEAPFTTITDVIRSWNQRLAVPVRWLVRLRPAAHLVEIRPQPVEAIAGFEHEVLIIHGTRDEVIPIELGRSMYEATTSAEKTWCPVEGAGHNDLLLSHPDVARELQSFFGTAKEPPSPRA